MPFQGPVKPPELKISAQEAAEAARKHIHLMNDNRIIPQVLDIVQQASDAHKVYLFNVGPWMQQRLMGSLGVFNIPACPAGQEYAGPVVLPGIVRELYPNNELEYKSLEESGMHVARNILGEGPHLSPNNSFRPYGVFISQSNPPKKEELEEARTRLRETYLRLINEADLAWSKGPKTAEETIMPEAHFVAARALKKTDAECPWMRNAVVPAAREACAGCGATYVVGVMKCRECGYILDKPKYDDAVKKGLFAA